jgi:vitamin B12 transporter
MTRPTVLLAAALAVASAAHAQSVSPPEADAARAAFEACRSAAAEKREGDARPAAARAASLHRQWMRAAPADPQARVGLASVKTHCEIPIASFMAQGRLVAEANELLEQALRIDSTHWEARFNLAMNHFHTPSFLGRGREAIRHFEILLEQQGDARPPHFAMAYLHLGDLYARSRRGDEARALWRRGADLFPADPRFAERLGPDATPGAGAPAAPAADPDRTILLEGIVVQGGNTLDDARSGTSLRRVDVLTTPGGTADLFHAFQTQPGLTRAAEGSDLYVRGGDPAEAPVFVDGARLFYPGRYETLHGGAFGILDSQVLRSAYFSAGGFSARYGDALSGVLDVTTVGRPHTRGLRVNANTVQLGTLAELPVGERAGAWASVRATDASMMLAMHGRGGEFSRSPRALETVAGAAWEPREGTELRAIAMGDEDAADREVDAYGYAGPFESRGSNRLAALSGRTLAADGRLGLRGSLSTSRRESRFRFGVLDRTRTDRGASVRLDADASGADGRFGFGVEGGLQEAVEAGRVPTTDRLAPGSPSRPLDAAAASTAHLGAYAEGERRIGPAMAVVAGLRADRLPGEDAWTVDPRAALAVSVSDWTLRLGGGLFHQGRWRSRYRVPDAGAPSGTPTRAGHLVAGAERGGEPSLRVEGYVKEYGRYLASGDGPRITAGRAAGADAIVRWQRQPRVNGWITYSFLNAHVDLEGGERVPSAVDVTHSLTGVARVHLRPQWELGTTLRLATGRPFTPVTGPDAQGGPAHGPVHSARMPDYARLDARLTRYLPLPAGVGVMYLETLNVLDRENVAAYTYDAAYAERRPIAAFFANRTLVLGMGLTF